jgi:molybdopterin-guanine dinucleotide biosynthesis protein A
VASQLPLQNVTAVVLAGGRSRRMGRDKAAIKLGERTMLENAVNFAREHFIEVLIAGGPDREVAGARLVPDLLTGNGAVIGIHAGLAAASTGAVFAMACDAPHPSGDLARYLATLDEDACWTVPRTTLGIEPLFALYRRACLPAIERFVTEGHRRLLYLAERIPTRFVEESDLRAYDPELASFVNLNTPADLAAWQAKRKVAP